MIYCVTQKPQEYVETLPNGQKLGLYTEYGHHPELFNLISRTVSAMFMFECGFEGYPVGKRVQVLFGAKHLVDTMEQEVDGVSIKTILKTTCPVTMYNLFKEVQPKHLEVINLYGSWGPFITTMGLRVLQFRKYYRGIINTNKNVIWARFQSELSEEEDKFLTSSVYTLRSAFEKKMLV